jgi:acetylornithine deacetylase
LSPLPTNDLEARVLGDIARRRADLVELCSELIRYDTSARGLVDRPGEEAALQAHLARRLRDAGLEIELWVPDPEAVTGVTMPPGFSFDGRPQLLGRRAGTGGGRNLLLNGHVDVVPPGPEHAWTAPPRSARVGDGRLYGLGACDMKGGVAAMVVAVEALAALRVETAGDLLVNTVTDEESTGAGTAAVVARGLPVDAAVIPEPTGLDLWTGSRGAGIATITVPGHPGHAGLARRAGDPAPAVNAIDATVPVLRALHRLRDDWRSDAALAHPLLGTGDIVPISIEAGDWLVTHPSSCRLRCHVSFTPSQADERGLGGPVRHELEERVAAAAAQDPWLRQNPPRIEWSAGVPTAEVPDDHPIVETLRRAAADVGRTSRLSSRTTWYDGVTLTRSGIPTVACGPGDIAQAHAVDEFVPVADLVATAQCLALTALRFCGPSRRA